MKTKNIKNPTIVSPEKWLTARREFLREEKEYTQMRDRLAARRRELPWVKVDQAYTFESPGGRGLYGPKPGIRNFALHGSLQAVQRKLWGPHPFTGAPTSP